MKEEKICRIYLTGIDENKEYCEFVHYHKNNKIKSKGCYHVNCFRNRLAGSNAQTAVANKAMEILDKVGMRV